MTHLDTMLSAGVLTGSRAFNIELNNLINLLHRYEISDRQKRIKAFAKIIKHVGITDFAI